MFRRALCTFLCLILLVPCAHAFKKKVKPLKSADEIIHQESICEKISFWKKTKWYKKRHQKCDKMPETQTDWQVQAQSIPLSKRDNPNENIKPDERMKSIIPPISTPNVIFVKYNNPPGCREVDISKIKQDKIARSEGVSSEDFRLFAYSEYNYYPTHNQISSEIFIIPLDTSKSRVERLTDVNILHAKRKNTLKSAKMYYKENLYSLLTVVDWSKNGDKIIVKEKVGTDKFGIYRTSVYVVFVDETGETVGHYKFHELEDTITKYWNDFFETRINFYKWDIKPLGWNKENEEEILAIAYAYNKEGGETYLGCWALNYMTRKVRLVSLTETKFDVAVYGISKEFEEK